MNIPGFESFQLESTERLVYCNQALLRRSNFLVGITRVRNESLILQDTLDYIGGFVDAIVAYDDASTDSTRDVLRHHPKVALMIENNTWRGGEEARLRAETRHRGLLLEVVRNKLHCEWIYCFDADERIVEDPRDLLRQVTPDECNGVRVQLFDAYMTPDDCAPYKSGRQLLNFRRSFGLERREILMLWRNASHISFQGLDAREPTGVAQIITGLHCQHYGKAISIAQWESTCDYYAKNFPWETYGEKWERRKGQAIHTQSDFSNTLCEWGPDLFNRAIDITSTPARSPSFAKRASNTRYVLLLTTNHLVDWTGSETMLLTLIEGLLSFNCEIVVYARYINEDWVKRYLNPRVELVTSLDSIRDLQFDLAHIQHSSCLMDVRAAFPKLPILFSSLGVLPFLEQPALVDAGVSQYLAISEEVVANLIRQDVPTTKISIVRNLVNERIFRSVQPIRPHLERVLVLSHRMDRTRQVLLRIAAREIGASIRFVGSSSDTLTQDQLATAINDADLVVSLGRGVVEAMFCGRVPLVFDVHGGDGLVTPENLEELKTCNFSGRYHRTEYTLTDIIAEFKKYRQSYGAQLQEMAKSEFALDKHIPRLLEIYSKTIDLAMRLSDKKLQAVMFCSTLALLDLQQSRLHQRAAAGHRNEIQRIRSTASWHITKPLRLLAIIAKFIRNNFLRRPRPNH